MTRGKVTLSQQLLGQVESSGSMGQSVFSTVRSPLGTVQTLGLDHLPGNQGFPGHPLSSWGLIFPSDHCVATAPFGCWSDTSHNTQSPRKPLHVGLLYALPFPTPCYSVLELSKQPQPLSTFLQERAFSKHMRMCAHIVRLARLAALRTN